LIRDLAIGECTKLKGIKIELFKEKYLGLKVLTLFLNISILLYQVYYRPSVFALEINKTSTLKVKHYCAKPLELNGWATVVPN